MTRHEEATARRQRVIESLKEKIDARRAKKHLAGHVSLSLEEAEEVLGLLVELDGAILQALVNQGFTQHEFSRAEAQERAIELALNGIPDPMHPGIPPKFVDGLVAAQIVLSAAAGRDDPGNVESASAFLATRGTE